MTHPVDDPHYRQVLERMEQAARAWAKANPFASLKFAPIDDVLRVFGVDESLIQKANREGQRIGLGVPLAHPDVIRAWAGNADAGRFLQALVNGTDGAVSFMQAQALVACMRDAHFDAATHEVDASRNRKCPSCAEELLYATNASGNTFGPSPGCMTICSNCAARLVFGDYGYELLTARDFGRLPKTKRMQLAKLQETVREGKRVAAQQAMRQN